MLRLASFEESHLPALMSWFTDEESCRVWGGPDFHFPFTEESFRESAKLDAWRSWSLLRPDGGLVGFGQYYERLGRCHLSRLVIAPAERRRGLGETLVRGLCARGREELGVETVSLFVLEDNEHATRLYRRLGFRITPYPEPSPKLVGALYMVASDLAG